MDFGNSISAKQLISSLLPHFIKTWDTITAKEVPEQMPFYNGILELAISAELFRKVIEEMDFFEVYTG